MSSRVNIFLATKQFLLKTDMSTVSQRTEILSWEIRTLLPAEQNTLQNIHSLLRGVVYSPWKWLSGSFSCIQYEDNMTCRTTRNKGVLVLPRPRFLKLWYV
jgi:hypothetical protein